MKQIAFVIDQKQDFYLALSFLFLLKESMLKENSQTKTVALITNERNVSEFEQHLNLFDQVAIIGHCSISPNPLITWYLIRQFRERVKRLSLSSDDVVIAFSFRQFFMNVFIRNLKPKPRLICVRKDTYELETQYTRKKTITSLYRNFWNFLYGYSLMKYRWHPETDRAFTYFFVKNPYDFEFCTNPVHSLENDGRQIPYPFPVLRAHSEELGAKSGKPSIIVLGEIYPLWEAMDMAELSRVLNGVLNFIRREFPTHKLIFKPRVETRNLDLNLEGFTVAFQNISLESLLLRDLSVEKVVSFKSSGAFIATLYGCDGYLLYPMLELPEGFRESLDAYFSSHRKSVIFVNELEDLRETRVNSLDDIAGKVRQMSQRFIDALL